MKQHMLCMFLFVLETNETKIKINKPTTKTNKTWTCKQQQKTKKQYKKINI